MRLVDPDRRGLSDLAPRPAAGGHDLALVDLTGTRLAHYRPGGAATTLVVTTDGTRFGLALAFVEAALPVAAAAAFLDGLAARVEDPIRHIL